MLSVIVVQVFKNVGLNMILFLAALQGVPEEMHGGRPHRRRRRVAAVPLGHAAADQPHDPAGVDPDHRRLARGVRPDRGAHRRRPGNSTTVLVYYLYQQAFRFNDFGYASAISVLLFFIVLVLTLRAVADAKEMGLP